MTETAGGLATALRTQGAALSIRPLGDGELHLFHRVVYDAATFRPVTHPPMEELLATDHYRPYVEGWGRTGDRCLLACLDGDPVGGVFYRLFAPPLVGDGYVDERTPELGIALFAGHRSAGLGRALIHAALAQARLDGFDAVSLGVADDNRAGLLYESVGFVLHRVIKGGRIMVHPLKRSS
jgi:GNAT superfamily N-acetyltransferase